MGQNAEPSVRLGFVFSRNVTLRSHYGTCLAPAGKCALMRAVRSFSFANKAQPLALARVIIINVDYQSTLMQEPEQICTVYQAAHERPGTICRKRDAYVRA